MDNNTGALTTNERPSHTSYKHNMNTYYFLPKLRQQPPDTAVVRSCRARGCGCRAGGCGEAAVRTAAQRAASHATQRPVAG